MTVRSVRRSVPLPPRLDRAIVLEFALFFGSVVALQGTRFLFTIVVAAGLAPAAFTGWTLFVTFVGYAPAILLGAGNGMNRLVPILVGAGRVREADQAESATWSVVALALAVALVVGVALALVHDPLILAAAMAGGLMAVYQVQQFSMRARLRFNDASLQQLAWAICVGVSCVALGLLGVSLTSALALWIIGSAFGIVAGIVLRRPVWTLGPIQRARPLLVTGIPIMLSGLAGSMFYTADRWVASITLDASAAGVYGFASLVAAAAFLVPMVIAQQQYPRLATLHGAGAPASQLEAAAIRQGLLAAATSLVAVGGIAVFALLIPWLLPAYAAAVAPTIILCLGLVAMAGATGYANAMVVVGALWRYLAVQGGCLAAAIVLMALGASTAGVTGLAIGAATGQSLLLLGVGIAGRSTLRRAARSTS